MIYARMANGHVVEIIEPFFDENGQEVPIGQRFPPEFVAELFVYDPENPPPPPPPPPEPTHAQLWERAITEMRAMRQPIILVLDGLQSSALTLDDTERAQVIETAKQGLRDITKLNLSDCTTYGRRLVRPITR